MNEELGPLMDCPARGWDFARDNQCTSCAERLPKGDCSESRRTCLHHCNHSWTHDACCWCGEEFGEVGGQPLGLEIVAPGGTAEVGIATLLEVDR
jgi:hypothetical protein